MPIQNTRRQFLLGSTLAASGMLGTTPASAAEAPSKDYPRDQVVIATKCGLDWSDGVTRNSTRKRVLEELEGSLRRLNTDYIDLYQYHWPDTAVPFEEQAALMEEFGEDARLLPAGGRALREMTRIAGSPYSMWRDIAISNRGNLEDALLKVEQRLAHIRENLSTRGLAEEFELAHGLKKAAGTKG